MAHARGPSGLVAAVHFARSPHTGDRYSEPPRRSGGIGRRASLRGWCPSGRGGSSPPSDTAFRGSRGKQPTSPPSRATAPYLLASPAFRRPRLLISAEGRASSPSPRGGFHGAPFLRRAQ